MSEEVPTEAGLTGWGCPGLCQILYTNKHTKKEMVIIWHGQKEAIVYQTQLHYLCYLGYVRC